jgi:hypothetical protein
VLVSLVPARQASRAALTGDLYGRRRGRAGTRSGGTCWSPGSSPWPRCCSTGSGLLLRSLDRLLDVPLGVEPRAC